MNRGVVLFLVFVLPVLVGLGVFVLVVWAFETGKEWWYRARSERDDEEWSRERVEDAWRRERDDS